MAISTGGGFGAAKQMLLEEALSEWASWTGDGESKRMLTSREPELVRTFTAGLNHAAALIRLDDELAVLKVFSQPASVELINHHWAANLGLAPQLLYTDADKRYAVMELAQGSELSPGEVTKEQLGFLARSLSKLHEADHKAFEQRGFDIQVFCAQYLEHAGAQAAVLHQEIEPLLVKFKNDSTPWCFCHNDLVVANCFVSEQAAMFIDWEYADYHNPWFDLAAIIYYFRLSESEIKDFLGEYGRVGISDHIINLSQVALLWGDMLWHLAKFGEAYWSELGQKDLDLRILLDHLKT